MADPQPLDPSVLSFLQGTGGTPQALPDGANGTGFDFSLPSSVTQAVQSGFAPSSAPPVVPDQPLMQAGLPASVTNAVRNGFAPPPSTSPPTTQALNGLAIPSFDQTAPAASPAPAQAPPEIEMPAMNAATGKDATPADLRKAAAYAASPEGLAARADTESRGAIGEERVASADAAAAEVAQNNAKENAMKASQDRIADMAKVNKAKNDAYESDIAKYTAQYAQQVKDAANFKVNTDRHISNTGLIAIALTGIGNAFDHYHGPNAALEIIEKGIDQRIADQWAQKKALGESAEQTKSLLGTARSNFEDSRQEQQLQRASDREKMADDLQLVAAQTANPMVKARAEAAAAQLTQKSAAITMTEAQRKAQAVREQQEAALKREEIGVHYANLAFEKSKWRDQYSLQVAQLEAAGKSEEAKAKADELKQYNEKGIGTLDKAQVDDKGNPVLDKNGQPVIESNPFVQRDGKSLWVPAGDASDINKLRAKKTAVDDLAQIMDDVQRLRTGYSSSAKDREEWQAIQAKWSQAKVKFKDYAGLGALSESDYKILDGGIGADDPTTLFDHESGIKAARTTMVDSLNHDMKNHLYTGPRYEPPDTSKLTTPTNSAMDKLAESATSRNFGERHGAVLAFAGGGAASDAASGMGAKERMGAFNQLVQSANGNDRLARNQALEVITKIATADGTPEDVKAAANDYLQRQVGLH